MLHHCIELEITPKHSSSHLKRLLDHADNFAGQNKNRFLLIYLCWRKLLGWKETVLLRFVVVSHTKTVVDGSFGHVKRKRKTSDTRTPAEMMGVVADSSETSHCVADANIQWKIWKDYLQLFFKMSCNFCITKYIAFRFENIHADVRYSKEFSL